MRLHRTGFIQICLMLIKILQWRENLSTHLGITQSCNVVSRESISDGTQHASRMSYNTVLLFEVFSTVHHSIELFHQSTLMHNFLYSLTICLLHSYPRHVSSINMPIFRRKNCIHTASGIFALRNVCTVHWYSQPDVYRQRRYQMLCEYNFSS